MTAQGLCLKGGGGGGGGGGDEGGFGDERGVGMWVLARVEYDSSELEKKERTE